jgi:ABC-2 type transport system permease protein
MRVIVGIAVKDLRLLARNRAGFFWVLGWPILMALFFGSIFSGGSEDRAPMPIAVVDMDRTDYSRAFTAKLEQSEALKVSTVPADSARLLVRRGDLVAYVMLRPGFGQSFGFGGGDSSGIELGLDPSRKAEAGYLEGLVTQAIFTSMEGQFTAGGSGRAQIQEALRSVEADTSDTPAQRRERARIFTSLEQLMTAIDSSRARGPSASGDSASKSGFAGPNIRTVSVAQEDQGPRNAYEITFPASMMWALIGVCMSFAISIVHERLTGTFLRLRLAPISRVQILLGKGLGAFLASLGATALLLLLASRVFHVRLSNPAELLAAILAASFCFTGLMMLIAVLGRTLQAVSGAGWAILLVMSMTGGGMIPLIAMPSWMRTVSHFSPVKWGVLAVEGAIWRGFSWGEMALPLGILLGVGATAFTIGAITLSRSET